MTRTVAAARDDALIMSEFDEPDEAAETTEAVAWWESMLARQVELDEAERLATWDEVLP